MSSLLKNPRPAPTVFVVALAVLSSAVAWAADVASLPPNVRRVLFLGDSITYGGGYVANVAAYFATRQPTRVIEFVNAGLSSETVSGLSEEGHAGGKFPRPDLHERLGRVLAQVKPDLVFACYGMNDGIYLPLAAERFARYEEGQRWLHEQVTAAGAKIVHVTPPVYDDVRGGKAGYAAVLDRYSEWLVTQRTAARWDVVDLHTPMRRVFTERRRSDTGFFLAKDGVHPGDFGHWLMARAILQHLGARDLDGVESAAAMAAAHPRGDEVLKLVTQKVVLLRDAWLTATRHTRPGVKPGLPLDEANTQGAAIDRQLASLLK